MEDEFYAIIKLISGEEIMALVSVDNDHDDPILILQNPIIMKMNNHGYHSFIKVTPWVELTDEDIFIIKLDKVMTMTETNNDRIIEIYNNFNNGDAVEEQNIGTFQTSGPVRPDSKMGYITSVKDARKKLEELLKLKIEPKES